VHSEKVPFYILDLLQQVPSVQVEGLGQFDAIFHPAIIDLHRAEVKPPFIQPEFIARHDSAGDLLPAYMSYVSGIDMEDAKENIRLFSRKVLDHLNAGDPYRIEKFGIFYKTDPDVIHFTPDWDAFNLSFSGLKIIELHPGEVTKAPISIREKPEPLEQKINHPDQEQLVETENLQGVQIKEEIEEVKDEEMNITSELPESTSRLAWSILASALLLITILCVYLAWDIISDRRRINQLTQLQPDTLIITNEFDIPFVMDTVDNEEDSVPKTTTIPQPDTIQPPVTQEEQNPCFVVVGAFTNADNIARMEQRLADLGYKSKQIKGGALTRVAISTSCDKANLEDVLNKARSTINSEAWIY
jgi:hypothetical protein